jgi:hypothetical protein
MSKNLQKVQDMLDGNYKNKIQSGYSGVDEDRKVGDKWTDSDGNQWEQKEGYRTKNTSNIRHHSWDEKCSSCEKLILKKWDKDTYKADGRCYHCQIDFEAELKSEQTFNGKPGIRWFAYRRLKDLRNMEAIHRDMEKWVFAKHEFEKNEKIFDEKVANAIANGEVELTINKNKTM